MTYRPACLACKLSADLLQEFRRNWNVNGYRSGPQPYEEDCRGAAHAARCVAFVDGATANSSPAVCQYYHLSTEERIFCRVFLVRSAGILPSYSKWRGIQ